MCLSLFISVVYNLYSKYIELQYINLKFILNSNHTYDQL